MGCGRYEKGLEADLRIRVGGIPNNKGGRDEKARGLDIDRTVRRAAGIQYFDHCAAAPWQGWIDADVFVSTA